MKPKRKLNPRGEAWGVIWDDKTGTGKLVQLYARGHINGVPFETGPKPDAKTMRKINLRRAKMADSIRKAALYAKRLKKAS